MADPFVAEIRIFPFNFAPRGWAQCDGQLLPISQNTALFSLLGTTYGGNGITNFGLPNLQGAAPMHPGQGPGLSLHDLGEQGGSDTATLLQTEMPAHTHRLRALADPAESKLATQKQLARSVGQSAYGPAVSPAALAPAAVSLSGGGLPHNNLQPYLVVNFCIALQGVFPPRP